jgi:hypothetical protein
MSKPLAIVSAALVTVALLTACSDDTTSSTKKTSSSSGGNASSSGSVNVVQNPNGSTTVSLGECDSCHTSDKSKRMAGGGRIGADPRTPDAVLYAPNLTPDDETGIGLWADEQLKLAIRDGVDREGVVMCPPMKHYNTISDESLTKLIAELRALPKVRNAVPKSKCPPIK